MTTPAQSILQEAIRKYDQLYERKLSYCSTEAQGALKESIPLRIALAELLSNQKTIIQKVEVIKEVPLKIEYIDKIVEKEVIKEVQVIKEVPVNVYIERDLTQEAIDLLTIEKTINPHFKIFDDSKNTKIKVYSETNKHLTTLLDNSQSKLARNIQLGVLINIFIAILIQILNYIFLIW